MIEGYNDLNNFNISDFHKEFIEDLFKYFVDPTKQFYNVSWKDLEERANTTMGKVAAIAPDPEDFNLELKNVSYDPVLEKFSLGSRGFISSWDVQKDLNTPLIIRGVGSGSQRAYRHCWETGRTFYAIDTGYFGNGKFKYWHRITKNNLQHLGPMEDKPDNRLKQISWKYKKPKSGSDILICPPSEKVMKLFDQPDPETWTKNVIDELKKYTDRKIRIRLKLPREQRSTTNTIQADLDDNVYCLITYNSIAATEAILHGKPAIALGPNAAQVLCNSSLSEIENLNHPTRDEVEAFARHLSYCQFTVHEMKNGKAWRIIHEGS